MGELVSLRFGRTWVLVAVVLAVPGAVSWSENDGRSGGDASDYQSSATRLSSWGSGTGTLHIRDVDWFAAPNALTEGSCVSLSSASSGASNLTLGVGSHTVTTPMGAGDYTTISLAGGPSSIVTAGITATGDDAAQWNAYNFTLRTQTVSLLAPADAGRGYDAGSTPATSIPITSGCYAGRLDPTSFDTSDVYAFNGTSGSAVVASLSAVSGIPLTVQILDANGVPLVSQTSTAGPLALALPSTGTFYLSTSSTGLSTATDYVFSLIGAVAPGPCRPMCTVT